MTTKNFLTAFGALWVLYGLLFLFGTDAAVNLYGSTDMIRAAMGTAEGAPAAMAAISNVKMLGGMLLSAGLMGLVARDARASYGRKGILVFITAANLMFLVFNLMGLTAEGNRPPIVWFDMIANALFFLGGAYFLTKEKGFETA